MMIEQATGQTYQPYCKQAVLTPHPFSDVQTLAGTAGLGAFGGWQMSAKQYANFISKNYRTITPAAKRSCKLPMAWLWARR